MSSSRRGLSFHEAGRSRLPAVAAAGFLLATCPAAALVYLMPTDEQLMDDSPLIVYGIVGQASPGPVTAWASTDVMFHVEETLRGDWLADAVVVRQPGGILPDGTVQVIGGLPRLREGDRMLLFLWPEDGAYQTVGWGMGMFREQPGPGGSKLLVRDGTTSPVALPDDPIAAKRKQATFPRHADGFRRWIRDRAAGVAREADYFLAERPDGLARVASPYNLLVEELCGNRKAPVRQRRFDRGLPLEFVVQADGQPLVEGGGVRELIASAKAWNNHPGSHVRVNLRWSNRRNKELLNVPDGLSTITFDDPDGTLWRKAGEPGAPFAVASWRSSCDAADLSSGPGAPAHLRAYDLVEVDIITNDGWGEWLRDETSDPRKHFAETITHEIGHALGIDHSCSYDPETWTALALESVMRPWSDPDENPRTVNADDLAASEALYPMPGAGAEWDERCTSGDRTLCLNDREYRVTAEWTTSTDGTDWRSAMAEPVNDNAGYFHFFGTENAELLIKILDGCAINGHKWVFAAGMTDVGSSFHVTELTTGRERLYRKQEVGRLMPAVTDTQAFPCQPEPASLVAGEPTPGGAPDPPREAVDATPDPGLPEDGLVSVALPYLGPPHATGPSYVINDRFRVYGEWRIKDRRIKDGRGGFKDRGALHGLPLTRDSMSFHFFEPANMEIVIKVLDGCAINGHRWLFAAGLTDVSLWMKVEDTETGQLWNLRRDRRRPFEPVRNLTAFRCS